MGVLRVGHTGRQNRSRVCGGVEADKRVTWRVQMQATCGQSRPGGLQHSGKEESSKTKAGWVPMLLEVGQSDPRKDEGLGGPHQHTQEAPRASTMSPLPPPHKSLLGLRLAPKSRPGPC